MDQLFCTDPTAFFTALSNVLTEVEGSHIVSSLLNQFTLYTDKLVSVWVLDPDTGTVCRTSAMEVATS